MRFELFIKNIKFLLLLVDQDQMPCQHAHLHNCSIRPKRKMFDDLCMKIFYCTIMKPP